MSRSSHRAAMTAVVNNEPHEDPGQLGRILR